MLLVLVGRLPDAIAFLMIFYPGPISAPVATAAARAGAAAVVGAEEAVAATTEQQQHRWQSQQQQTVYICIIEGSCNPMQRFTRTELIQGLLYSILHSIRIGYYKAVLD